MVKKYQKISSREISKRKFDALLDTLPSLQEPLTKRPSTSHQNETVSENSSEGIIADNLAGPDKTGSDDIQIDNSEVYHEFESSGDLREIFVFKKNEIFLGVPVNFVSEITNEYGKISQLNNFLRSCLGTIDFRGVLLPIFDSYDCHLRANSLDVLEKSKVQTIDIEAIIALNYNNVKFALTMDTHVGIFKLQNKKNFDRENNVDGHSTLLDDVFMFNGENVFIISPQKIAQLVTSEFKSQLALTSNDNKQVTRDQRIEKDTGEKSYLIVGMRDSKIAVELSNVLEILEGIEVTPLYQISDFLRGLINLRGQVLGCVDLSKFLNQNQTILDERNKFVVLSSNDVEFAICVDETFGISKLSTSDFQETSRVFSDLTHNFFTNFHRSNETVIFIFQPDAFVTSEEILQYSGK